MNNLFRLKGKMHRLVNMLFYIVFFVAGFLVGRGVNFEKISNFFNSILQ